MKVFAFFNENIFRGTRLFSWQNFDAAASKLQVDFRIKKIIFYRSKWRTRFSRQLL